MNPGTAFVFGGTGGLGSAICRSLAAEWESVAIGYRSREADAQKLADELNSQCLAIPVRCDLTRADEIAAAISGIAGRTGRIGTMVFASGVAIEQPFVSKIEESSWREVIETELLGFIRVVAATLPIFRCQGSGNFVAVVSVAAYSYPPGDALSAVPKAGIEMLGRAIAKEEGRFNIRANMVAPGIIDAGLGETFLKELYTPEIWETQRKHIALQRFGDAGDVADAVAFLASERARYITGQTLIVDGGFSL
jgi:2-hydroxycyclohexanecarboxyl-CoA dehydrogenase